MKLTRIVRAASGVAALALCAFTVGQSAASTLNPDHVGALWVAHEHGLSKVSTDTGATMLEVGDAGQSLAVAVDYRRNLVWSYSDGKLRAGNFAGQTLASLSVPASTPGKGQEGAPTALAVNEDNGSLWLARGTQLLHLDSQGAVLQSLSFDDIVVALVMDQRQKLLWVASRKSVSAHDDAGARVQSLPLAQNDTIQDICLDVGDRALWLADQKAVRRLDAATGQLVFEQARSGVLQVACPGAGGLWAATSKELTLLDRDGAQQFPAWSFSGGEAARELVTDAAHMSVWVMGNKQLTQIGVAGSVLQQQARTSKMWSLAAYADTTAPTLVRTAPESGSYLNDNLPVLEFSYADAGIGVDPASLTVAQVADNGTQLPIPLSCEYAPAASACIPTSALADGYYALIATIADYSGNLSAPATASFIVDTAPPIITIDSPVPDLVTTDSTLSVSGQLNEPAVLSVNGQEVALDDESRFANEVALTPGVNSISLSATDLAGNLAQVSRTVTLQQVTGTPDPSDVAPVIDQTVATTVFSGTEFLYTGSNPIQKEVVPGTIEAKRAAVLRGEVSTRENAPLAGVKITILGQPKYGHTQTRADGLFDMVVNGGGVVTVQYEKAGFLPVQRQVNAPWQDYAWADPVVMIPLDPQVTAIDLSTQTEVALAQGTVQNDAAGVRQATLLFLPGTQAALTLPDGSVQPLSKIHVRATEYTVGDNGPDAMPGPLPPTSGYTYAVELSVDEAIAVGATRVDFSQPVYNYVENFLDFPVGGIVPTGYYDRISARWIPSENGRIIKILGIEGGAAIIDADGDGQADSAANLAVLNLSEAERVTLATTYRTGQSLWRVPITHFTPWDHNWPVGPPSDAIAPKQPKPTTDEVLDDCTEECGSIIESENQILRERLPITGTPFTLNYSSGRVAGNKAAFGLKIPISGGSVPASLRRIDVWVHVAGRRFFRSFPPAMNQAFQFVWDGYDAYGRQVVGPKQVDVQIGYVYPAIYQQPADFAQSFAAVSGSPMTGSREREEITIWQGHRTSVGSLMSPPVGLGAWSIDVHHSFDVSAQALSLGTGRSKQAQSLNRIMTTVAGTGSTTSSGDGKPAVKAGLRYPFALAFAADGSMYISEFQGHRIRKVLADGTIVTVAGTGRAGFSGDGGPATQAMLNQPGGMAVAADGSLYIADYYNHRVRKVAPDGIISTVAGNGHYGYGGDGGPATEASLYWPEGVAVAPDNTLYIADHYNSRIRRVSTDGFISTVAGTGEWEYSGDGGPATLAGVYKPNAVAIGPDGSVFFSDRYHGRVRRIGLDGIVTTVAGSDTYGGGDGGPATQGGLYYPAGIAVGLDGGLYIAEIGGNRIRRVGTDGIITTFAGSSAPGFANDGASATMATLYGPTGVAVAPDGSVYVADYRNFRVRRVGPPVPGLDEGDFLIPSGAGDELYHFSSTGRHLRTLDATGGNAIYSFEYDDAGLLESITDLNNNVTRIERHTDGTPRAIVAPGEQRTTLALDASGYLATVTNPGEESTSMVYTPDGLLTTFTDAEYRSSTMKYDELGRLQKDSNADRGSWTLERNEFTGGFTASLTSAMDRVKSHRVERLRTGERLRTSTSATGAVNTTLEQTNGTTVTTAADGTILTQVNGPDPRFGMQAPIVASLAVKTPSGLTSNVTTTRVVTLANADDPLSVKTLIDTVTANGRKSTQTYTAATRSLSNKSPSGRTATSVFDDMGRVISTQVPGLLGVDYFYDDRGRVKQIIQGTGEEQRTFSLNYDAEGNVDAITDALQRTQRITHDPVGRPKTVTTSNERVIGFDYDKVGNVTALTPPERPAHGFGYTPVNLESAYTPPSVDGVANPATAFRYNPDKQPTNILHADGQTIVFDYEANGRLKQIAAQGSPAAASVQTDFGYVGNTSRVASIRAATGVELAYQYDGSLLLEERAIGPVAGTVNRAYDNDFRVKSLSLNGNAITLGYDADSLLTQAGDLTLTRDLQNGLLTGTTLGTLLTSQSYNGFGELGSFNAMHGGTGLYSASYRRDAAGRITEKTETIGSQADVYRYEYDAAGRLWQVYKNAVLLSEYRYDGNGNRLSKTTPTGTVEGRYDAQDRLQSYGNITYTYSAHGDLTSKTEAGQRTGYQYDVLGNLRHVELASGANIEYVIDGRNRRVGKKVNGTLVQGFLYQDQLKPIAELDGAGNVVSRFVYATKINVPDYLIKGGQTYRIVSDHLGSPSLVVNISTGEIAQRMEFDEFGNVLADSNPGFQPFGFAGGIYDRATGLTRFGARDYDPEIGRWTAKDPIRFNAGDSNLYAYVGSDPINLIDPSGLYCLSLQEIKAIAGGITGAIGGLYIGAHLGPAGAVIVGVVGGAFGALAGAIDGADGFTSMLPGAASGGFGAGGRAGAGGSIVAGAIGGTLSDEIQAAGGHRLLALPVGGVVGGGLGAAAQSLLANKAVSQALMGAARGGGLGVALGLLQAGIEIALEDGNDCGCSQ